MEKRLPLICVSNDKQSKEKFDVLRGMGAEVVVCPTAVAPMTLVFIVSKRLSEETLTHGMLTSMTIHLKTVAHYEQTGPEIWNQTGGKIIIS